MKCQPAFKPGSVRRAVSRARDGHSSGTAVTGRLEQPTRAAAGRRALHASGAIAHVRTVPCHPYSVLLPVGLAVPLLLPVARCALTAPFHPCRRPVAFARVAGAVYFLWRCPWGRPRRTLSGTVSRWSPDFPPPRGGGRPAGWPGGLAHFLGQELGFLKQTNPETRGFAPSARHFVTKMLRVQEILTFPKAPSL